MSLDGRAITILRDDGVKPREYELAEYQDLLNAARTASRQQEIALHTMRAESDNSGAISPNPATTSSRSSSTRRRRGQEAECEGGVPYLKN